MADPYRSWRDPSVMNWAPVVGVVGVVVVEVEVVVV